MTRRSHICHIGIINVTALTTIILITQDVTATVSQIFYGCFTLGDQAVTQLLKHPQGSQVDYVM